MEIGSIDRIPMMSMAIAQAGVLNDVGTSVLSKTLDVASQESAQLVKMMELSVNPGIGANFDMSV